MSKVEFAEVYNPGSWPTEWNNISETKTTGSPYSEITDSSEVYSGDDSHEANYKREICYWSSPRGRAGVGLSLIHI